MQDEPMSYYLLDPHEAELLAVFRQLSTSGQALVASVIASQYTVKRQKLVKSVELRLVKGA